MGRETPEGGDPHCGEGTIEKQQLDRVRNQKRAVQNSQLLQWIQTLSQELNEFMNLKVTGDLEIRFYWSPEVCSRQC